MEENGNMETMDLTCIHWGYLNVLQLNDVSGKKIKHPSWSTYWADLCGSTLRLYKDVSLPEGNCDFPPATVIGPRPENRIKHAFFSLKCGTLRDNDALENIQSPRLRKKRKLSRKHVLQVVLANFSVYFFQAPTMSAFYRWRTKIQSSIDNADSAEKLYDQQLGDAKMAMYEQQRCHFQPEPTYLDVVDQDTEVEENVSPATGPIDPRVVELKEKLLAKTRLLRQLEKQERDFLGTEKENKCTVKRIEFSATARKEYFLVIGRRDTLIPEGQTFTVFGRLPNGRWRCFVDREDRQGSCVDNNEYEYYSYPLIGSVPTSVILELNQPSHIKDLLDSISISSSEISSPKTPADDVTAFTYDVIAPPSSQSTPYSNHEPNSNTFAPHSSQPARPTTITPSGNLAPVFNTRTQRPSDSSISPTSPMSDTPTRVSNAISDLNQALQTLAALTPRSRVSSNVSTCSRTSRTSNSSQEDDSFDMDRGSRIELVSDEESSNVAELRQDVVARRRKRRDIQIQRKLHAKGISIIVGSSSSSEDEEDCEEMKQCVKDTKEPKVITKTPTLSRKLEGLHSSKERLTDKVAKDPVGVKPLAESTSKLPNGDRSNVDKPTTTTDLLREFSENGCYGLPIRNSVTQSQFKPLASHEIPPPLNQRRTLQMTRKEDEGFGFVLQTNTIVQPGAYSDSMTFVSNVSEDGPAYLAGMRPGDVIIEVENVTVEDDDHQMIVESLKSAGLTIRLVVVYKDAIQRMRLSTRLLALKARLGEAENAYDTLTQKEEMIMSHEKDPSALDIKVRMKAIYIHIQIASTTFARDTADIKNYVAQTKRTPIELLQQKRTPDVTNNCGVSTTGYELVREFATTSEVQDELASKDMSLKYASDTALNLTKKKTSDGKQKTLKQTQRSSFVSYVDFGVSETVPRSAPPRRRVKSDGYDPDDISTLKKNLADEVPPLRKTLPAQQFRVNRPESYRFALGSQNAIDTSHFRDLPQSRIKESSLEDGYV